MHNFASIDLKLVNSREVLIDAASPAALYGAGVFTTISINAGRPFLWDKHWRRLKQNAQAIGIDISADAEPNVVEAVGRMLDKNRVVNGKVRITFFTASGLGPWSFASSAASNSLIISADRAEIPANFKLGVSAFRTNTASPLAGIKSCNYLDKILALDEAKARGFHEAVQRNERGEVVSACTANLFWVKGGRLFTPGLETGCLNGTTREFILENLECEQTAAGIEDIKNADALFLSSAGLGVVQAAEFDGKRLEPSRHAILEQLPVI